MDQANRHLPGREFFQRLNARLRGHYNYYGLTRELWFAVPRLQLGHGLCIQWLNRRGGKRKSFTWEQFTQVLDRVKIARPCITEVRRPRVYA